VKKVQGGVIGLEVPGKARKLQKTSSRLPEVLEQKIESTEPGGREIFVKGRAEIGEGIKKAFSKTLSKANS